MGGKNVKSSLVHAHIAKGVLWNMKKKMTWNA